jgi:hypothetical protein
MSGLRDLILEVQRRSIWWALGAYIAVAFLVFELIKQIGESAGQPWLPNIALVLLLIGLPVVIGTALVRNRPVEGANETPGQASSVPISAKPAALFNARNTVVAGVLVAAAVFTVMNTDVWPMGGDAGVEVATTLGDASAVVLPLDNIGGREEMAYLSEGITEQITAQLAKVPEHGPTDAGSICGRGGHHPSVRRARGPGCLASSSAAASSGLPIRYDRGTEFGIRARRLW